MTEEVQGDEAPVDAVETEVFSKPVVILIFSRVQALDVFDMARRRELQLYRQFA